jgi:hypothetical protein
MFKNQCHEILIKGFIHPRGCPAIGNVNLFKPRCSIFLFDPANIKAFSLPGVHVALAVSHFDSPLSLTHCHQKVSHKHNYMYKIGRKDLYSFCLCTL